MTVQPRHTSAVCQAAVAHAMVKWPWLLGHSSLREPRSYRRSSHKRSGRKSTAGGSSLSHDQRLPSPTVELRRAASSAPSRQQPAADHDRSCLWIFDSFVPTPKVLCRSGTLGVGLPSEPVLCVCLGIYAREGSECACPCRY